MSVASAPISLSEASLFITKKNPVEESRTWVRVGTNNATVFSPDNNNSMVFKFPDTNWLDDREALLTFHHRITLPETLNDTTYGEYGRPRLNKLASSWIRRITIRNLADGSILEEIDNYNVIHRLMVEAFASREHKEEYLNAVAGYADDGNSSTPGQRETSSKNGKQYTFALSLSGILSSAGKYFPLKLTKGLEVEIYLESFANSHQVGYAGAAAPAKTGASYQISNAYFVVPIVKMDPEYDAKVAQLASSGQFVWNFESFDKSTTDLVQADSYRYQLAFNARYLKSIFGVMRLNDTLNAKWADKTGTFDLNNFKSYQFDVGGVLVPQFDVNSTTLAYQMLYSSMNLMHNSMMGGIDFNDYTTDKFIFAMDMEASMLNDEAISGVDVQSKRISLHLQHEDTPDSARLDVFCLSDKAIRIFDDGRTEKVY